MGYLCDFCGDQRSMVFCRSDDACLCLSCDQNVHSANALSKKHSRALLCDRCNGQPALLRCVQEKVSLCQNCDWSNHGTSSSGQNHRRQAIICYSGCPSAAELASMWSFVLDMDSVSGGEKSTCEQEMGQLSISEQDSDSRQHGSEKSVLQQVKGGVATDSSGAPNSVPLPNSSTPSISFSDPEIATLLDCHGAKNILEDNMYGEIDIDEGDVNFENYEELFGVNFKKSEDMFHNVGIDSLCGTKVITGAGSCYKDTIPTQGLSNPSFPACSNTASVDSIRTSKTEPIINFSTKQSNSDITFSGYSADTYGEYQDCGASSPILPMGEPPWLPSSTRTSATRAIWKRRRQANSRRKSAMKLGTQGLISSNNV